MAKNTMTPEQDLLTREFYIVVAQKAEDLLPNAPAYARQIRAICLLLLNYDQLPSGAYIEKGKVISMGFGTNDYSDYKDEWPADTGAALAQREIDKHEADNDTDTSEASTSESSEDTEVRETLLPEDLS